MYILCLIFSWVRNITIVTVPLSETSSNMYKRSVIKNVLYNTANKRVKISKRSCHARTESCCSLSSVTSSRLKVVYSQKRKNILSKIAELLPNYIHILFELNMKETIDLETRKRSKTDMNILENCTPS